MTLVNVRKYNGKIKQVDQDMATIKVAMGYYQYNAEEDLYEFTDHMNDLIRQKKEENAKKA